MAAFLKNLLHDATKRAGIKRQVQASQIVRSANDVLKEMLPVHAKHKAIVRWYRDGVFMIDCAGGPVAQFVHAQKHAIMSSIRKRSPNEAVKDILTRIRPIV